MSRGVAVVARDYEFSGILPFSDGQIKLLRRFWSKVRLDPDNGCLLWTGAVNEPDSPYKYGRFRYRSSVVYAHRFSLHMFGEGMTDEQPYALHTCDNGLCVNPKHLRRGTLSDNQEQRWKRTGKHKMYGDEPCLGLLE